MSHTWGQYLKVYNWFISLIHNTDTEQVLQTESIAVMVFCYTFVELSFFIFICSFLGRWTMLAAFGIRFSWERRKEYRRCVSMECKVAYLGRRKDKLRRAIHISIFPKAFVVDAAVSNVSRYCYSFMSQVLGSVLWKLCNRCSAKKIPQEEGLWQTQALVCLCSGSKWL